MHLAVFLLFIRSIFHDPIIPYPLPINFFAVLDAFTRSTRSNFHARVPNRILVATHVSVDGVDVGVASALLATRMHPSCSRGISEKSILRPLPLPSTEHGQPSSIFYPENRWSLVLSDFCPRRLHKIILFELPSLHLYYLHYLRIANYNSFFQIFLFNCCSFISMLHSF